MLRGKTSSSKHNHNNNNLNYNITNAITIVKQKTIISKNTFYLNETITSVTLSRESKRKENKKNKNEFTFCITSPNIADYLNTIPLQSHIQCRCNIL